MHNVKTGQAVHKRVHAHRASFNMSGTHLAVTEWTQDRKQIIKIYEMSSMRCVMSFFEDGSSSESYILWAQQGTAGFLTTYSDEDHLSFCHGELVHVPKGMQGQPLHTLTCFEPPLQGKFGGHHGHVTSRASPDLSKIFLSGTQQNIIWQGRACTANVVQIAMITSSSHGRHLCNACLSQGLKQLRHSSHQ